MPYSTSQYRSVPRLPSIASLPFPANLIRQCSDCNLRAGCTAPVPGENVNPCQVMLIGQNPGRTEDREGSPFIGDAGQYLDSLLFQSSISRASVCITNLVKCLTPNNRAISQSEIHACSRWLELELSIVRPQIIVAMGAPAIYHFLGTDAGTVEHLHGRPVTLSTGQILLPVYHPASALHDTAKLRQCSEDFQVLRELVKGRSVTELTVRDEYPNPEYIVADTPAKLNQMRDEIHDSGEMAIDTELWKGNTALWSAQVSAIPSKAWFIPVRAEGRSKMDFRGYDALAILHNELFDIEWVDVGRFTDSMVMAYLLGLPKGLKELATRLCGIKMINYTEMVKPGQQKLSLEYLNHTSNRDWPDPPLLSETEWDNKKGCLVTKDKKPWHISRKIKKMLDDFESDNNTDLWERWQNIPDTERAIVESVLGAMPESTLADISFEDAVQYASRDASATLRVYHKLKQMISDIGLDFVLDMDLGILPMVSNMMRSGMAVDIPHLKRLSQDYDVRLRVKAAELAGLVGHAFNPASSAQVASVVYEELGFKPTKRTETGLVSTDDAELKKTGHPVAKGIIQYRGLQKLKGTYADALVEWARPDDKGIQRVHTTLNTTRVETGRLASSDPNLQNIPTRNKEAKAIKNAFIAPEGSVLVEADYKQIEMVTLSHLSRCKRLVELFNRGGDPHTEMAARIFGLPMPRYEKGVPDESEKSKYRYPVKRLNFGIAYLIGAHGLANQIQEYIADLIMEDEPVEIEPWDEPTCEKFIAEWYKLNPEVRDFQMERAAEARRYGYVRDMFGRIRYIPEIYCPVKGIQEAGMRQAANFPITSSAQGIIKLAMRQVWDEQQKEQWHGRMNTVMQIHDSLVSEVGEDKENLKECTDMLREKMTKVVQLIVPVGVDFKYGVRWGDMKKLD